MNRKIEKLYFNVKFPASFSGLNKFYKEAKKVIPKLTRKDIRKWSQTSNTYTIHKSARKNFNRERIFTRGIDYLWEIDLVEVQFMQKENDGYRYLLMCIDTFSKYAWVRPLRNKTSSEVSKAFKSIIEDRKPKKVQYDQGMEFKNKEFQKLLREYDIISYEARNDTKAAIVERFNRTFKNKMYRYLTAENTLRYIDVLQDLIESYNNTYHRSIKMKPINVNEENEKKVHKTLLPINRMKAKSKYKIGDYVRLSRKKRMFSKEHSPNWTEEIFIIRNINLKSQPVTYYVKDLLDEDITEKFYVYQLQKVQLPEIFTINKIHRYRNKKREALVSWRGYPDKFLQWIPTSDIQEIQNFH